MSRQRSKKPELFHINKMGVGQLNKAYDKYNGKTYERAEFLFILKDDKIEMVKPAYDPDHFIYQRHMPQTENEVRTKWLGILPEHLRGPVLMCTCGAQGVVMLDGPYSGLALCKSVAMYGKHQTSFKMRDGELILDRRTADTVMLTDAEMLKNLRTEEEEKAIGR